MTKSRINSEKLIEKQLVQKYNYKKRKEYEQKKHIMSFRCNDEIYEKIKSESQRLNISYGEYISKCIEGCNIINIDDINGRIILENIKNLNVPCVTYGINYEATFTGKNVKLYEDKTVFTLVGPDNFEQEITLNMVGQFTVYNALATICACYMLNMKMEEIIERISKLRSVNGRFEKIENNKNLHVFVDYAHTPDALDNVLKSIKEFARGKIITVFGCGGNREKEKRPIMGNIAQQNSDFTIITSDNPRYEEPKEIIKDILEGIDRSKDNYMIIEDRKEAIKEAITKAKKGDTILIAGKGHENYQIIKDEIIDFDDKIIAKEIMDNIEK